MADPERPFDLLDTFVDPYNEIAELERVHGGRIVIFVDDESHSLVYKSQGIDPSVENLEALGISAGASGNGVDIIEVNGESCIYALSGPFSLLDEDDDTLARIALIQSVEGLSALLAYGERHPFGQQVFIPRNRGASLRAAADAPGLR